MLKNPWEAGKGRSVLDSDGVDSENSTSAYDPCNFDSENERIQWINKEGIIFFQLAIKKGFTVSGALVMIAQAYCETVTMSNGRINGYASHNWWNFGALRSKHQTGSGSHYFAKFPDIYSAFDAYIDRITSTPDYIAWHNPNYNPSYPDFGPLLRKDTFPTEEEIDNALQKGGQAYCTDKNKDKYAASILSVLTKYVIPDMQHFINKKLLCLEMSNIGGNNSSEIMLFRIIKTRLDAL